MLDDIQNIKKFDKENVLGSIESISDQCTHAWKDAQKVQVPNDYSDINAVVMCAMGGSGLGARVIESVYKDQLKVPFIRINDYNLPSWTNENTLVFVSSYSGTTEEVLNNTKQAIEKNARWIAIGSGGTLIDMAKEHNAPFYQINPKFNPSKQPRMAIGYSVIGQLVLASKTGLISITKEDINTTIDAMKNIVLSSSVNNQSDNKAKELAHLMKDKFVTYISSQHLVGSTHTVNNQLNENAKAISADYEIPELNHHLMEGLPNPKSNKDLVIAIFANSDIYSDRIQERMTITQEVYKKNGIPVFEYKTTSKTKLSQAFEFIQFGAYANLYLSILYKQNPAPIPWVDYFKTKLGQPLGK